MFEFDLVEERGVVEKVELACGDPTFRDTTEAECCEV